MSILQKLVEGRDTQLLACQELRKLSNLANDFKNYLCRKNAEVGFFPMVKQSRQSLENFEKKILKYHL